MNKVRLRSDTIISIDLTIPNASDGDMGRCFYTEATARTVSGEGCVPMRSRALPTGADMATEVGSYTNWSSTLAQLYGKTLRDL